MAFEPIHNHQFYNSHYNRHNKNGRCPKILLTRFKLEQFSVSFRKLLKKGFFSGQAFFTGFPFQSSASYKLHECKERSRVHFTLMYLSGLALGLVKQRCVIFRVQIFTNLDKDLG